MPRTPLHASAMAALPDPSLYALYFVLVAGVILLPGMDMAYVLGSALARGPRAGLAAVAGTMAGGVVHLAAGAFGVGLLLLSAPALYRAVLLAGALYMAWLGVSLWRSAEALGLPDLAAGPPAARGHGATFGAAMATCLLNPKAYVFMLAVFPQFLRPGQGPLFVQALLLGGITAATQAGVYGSVALGAGWLRGSLKRHPAAPRRLGRAAAVLLVSAAAVTLWQGWQGAPA